MLMIVAALFAAGAAPATCAPVQIVGGKAVPAALVRKTRANFATAYGMACMENMFQYRPLIPTNGANAGKLFLINTPDANIVSIVPGPGRMELEYSFVPTAGKAQVPTAGELHEAIYCAVRGASPKEQQEDGRCLPD